MEYKTERGITIQVVPIPMLLDELQRNYPDIPAPTYTETIAGGGTQTVTITETDAMIAAAENPEWWGQHKPAWEAYQKAVAERSVKVNEAVWRAICLRAIQIDLPVDESWIDDHRSLGMAIPDNQKERRLHYIRTEVVGGPRDMIRITGMAAGVNIDEEALERVEGSFRGQLSGAFTL